MERTIPNLLADAADAAAEAPWLFVGDAVFTYGDAECRVGSMAAGLAALGVARGDLVLVPMSNTAGHLFTWLALMRLGAVLVAANPASGPAETSGLVAETGPRLVLDDADVEGLLAAWADLGFRPEIVRGFALLARTAGLIGHLAEEMTDPIGLRLWLDVEHRVTYTAEPPDG